MIHILDYKSATFDFNPEILLQYVDLPRIFQKFVSETDYVKEKLKKDGLINYQQVSYENKFTVNKLSEYIEKNSDISLLFCNIDIFEEFEITPNYFFTNISKKYPHIKFIVSSDETFFKFTKTEHKQDNVFYILNALSSPYSFVDDVNAITNFSSYYIMNDYLQEDYCKFIKGLSLTSNRIVKDKKYNFYNGVHKPHRLKCYELIKNNDLLDEGYFSYADFAYLSKEKEYNQEFMEFFNMKSEKEYEDYLSTFQIPLFYDTEKSDPNIFVAFAIPPQTSFQSYISITTETHFYCEGTPNDMILSEKAFKPFYGMTIPLIIGQPIGLKYLKDLGFDLFEDFFDVKPTYTKKDTFEQLDKNLKKIKSLSKEEIHDFYFKNYHRVQNNFDVLTERLKERDIENLNNFLNA